MNEEIKEDNNCIVKAFENNPIAIITEEIDNKKIYCFKANDIGKALKLSNIAVSIQSYDDDERVLRKAYDSNNIERDTTFLTSQGVYRLLYNSKKEGAKKFRKWAGNILDDIIFNESAELKRQLKQQKNLIEDKDKELEHTKNELQKISKLKTKKWYDTEAGDILYGVISNTEDANSIIKLGKAKNGTNREGNYFTHNQTGEMFYIRKCYNCYLAEKVLFHILDKYRIHNNKEWFNISKDLAIYSIDIVCNFLDNFINYSEVLLESNLLENLKNSLDIVKNLSDDDKIIYNKDEININKNDNIIKTKNTIKKIEKPKEDVYDFHKFFKENCEIGIDFECSTYDIYGAYRLWSKIVRVENKNKFTEFLNINYKKKRKFFKDIKTSMSIYIGFKVKPFQILQENLNILPKYEEFILTNCDFAYNNKTSVENLIEEWNDWIKDYQDYDYNVLEERQFKSYINRHFLKTNMKIPSENGSIECNGIWGLKLKKIDLILSKNHKSTSKKILKIDVKTQQILEEYDSIMMLYDILKTSRRTIHTYIQLKTIFDEKYMYKFKEEI